MSEYHELQREALEARVGADRMAMGHRAFPTRCAGIWLRSSGCGR